MTTSALPLPHPHHLLHSIISNNLPCLKCAMLWHTSLFLDILLQMLIPPTSLQLFYLSADVFSPFVIHLKYLFFRVFLTVNQCHLWSSIILCNHLLILLSCNDLSTLTCELLRERDQVLLMFSPWTIIVGTFIECVLYTVISIADSY